MRENTPFRLGRAIKLGLALGAGGAAALLVGQAVTLMHRECSDEPEPECEFEQDLARDLARLHGVGAVGLALLSAGLAWSLRGDED
jgi:hypothetical protein